MNTRSPSLLEAKDGHAPIHLPDPDYRSSDLVELEEVEHGINTLAGVRECAAIYKRNEQGFGEIVAHVAAEPGTEAAELLKLAAKALPAYMLTTRIVLHPQLPKNANGNIDRKALD